MAKVPDAATDGTRKKVEEAAKAPKKPGQPSLEQGTRKRLEASQRRAEKELSRSAEIENAKNEAVGKWAEGRKIVQPGDKAREAERAKRLEKPQNELKAVLEGVPPAKRQSVIDGPDKAIPGFKKDPEKTAPELNRTCRGLSFSLCHFAVSLCLCG